ncbi:hypothetical protein [Streptomyces sp. NPDC057694]|uniref:hypothetical protein n=1 Tax=Streptomyces sp. NPDC057694 TaxID=3346216 RepID=UPI0036D0E683
MSTTTPPPQPDFPPAAPPEPPTTKRASNAVVIGAAAAIIAAIVGTGLYVVQSRDDSKPAATASSSETPKAEAAAEEEEETGEPTFEAPTADDFTMTLKTTKRQCFGSAGCNVTVEPRLTYDGIAEALDPDAVYEITYEISGDASGTVTETAELSDQTSLNYTPSLISTASASTKVSVEITDVAEQG